MESSVDIYINSSAFHYSLIILFLIASLITMSLYYCLLRVLRGWNGIKYQDMSS